MAVATKPAAEKSAVREVKGLRTKASDPGSNQEMCGCGFATEPENRRGDDRSGS